MQELSDAQLAETIRDAINEAETRAINRGKTRIARLLHIAHRALGAAGEECVDDDDIDVGTQSTGGPKP